MEADKQRIAIAEACGWKLARQIRNRQGEYWDVYERGNEVGSIFSGTLPDYSADLNALHEAEQTLDSRDVDTRSKWLDLLAVTCNWPKTKNAAELKFEVSYLVARSTAAQRAEAFLRTIGKWEDNGKL